MIIGGLDIETTGLEYKEGHKIIELALIRYEYPSIRKIDSYIKRFDPQCPIDPKAQAVHGISYEDLAGEPTFESQAKDIAERLASCDLLVAHNIAFDGPFVTHELVSAGQKAPNSEYFCTMENARWACPDGKLPKLGELCFALGVDYDTDKAHGALYDVEVMLQCLFEGVRRGAYQVSAIDLEERLAT